jgi:hypothetical protein
VNRSRRRTSPFASALGVCLVAVAAVAAPPAEAPLEAGLVGLWPGWRATPSPAGTTPPDSVVDLLAAAAGADPARLRAATTAGRVAASFHEWAERQLPDPPRFDDAAAPAPPAWAGPATERYAREEAGLLRTALGARDAEAAAEAVRAFLRVRYRRIAAMDAPDIARLRRAEQAEGLALYTAWQALRDTGDGAGLAPALRDMLRARLAAAAAGTAPPPGPAASGFALALVLDRARRGWREELPRGWRALDALLARPVRPFGSADEAAGR